MTKVTIVPQTVTFEADKKSHSPVFHFVNETNEVINDISYSIHYTSEHNGYDSDLAPILPEYYAANITIINQNKYQLVGKSWVVFQIKPPSIGLDNLKNDFNAVSGIWGDDGNNGVYKDNVTYHEDCLKFKVDGASRCGAAICSKDYYQEGSFEFIASSNSKSGVCMAFWTFFYANGGQINNEIDFELYGQNSIIYSAYTSEDPSQQTHYYDKVDFNIYDDKIHTYRFDWYAGEKVEFYIDEVFICEITENVPTFPMKVWIGAWCPSWAGNPTNEISTMTVYSFIYKSFN